MENIEYDTKTILYLTFELLVATFSVFGNGLVALTFLRDPTLRTPTNLFVFALALTDLLTSAVATPLYVHSMITKLPHDFRACICVQSLILTFCTVSIFHLTAVSFDRYNCVVWRRKPSPHNEGMRRASCYIGCAWIGGVLIGCMPMMGWNAGGVSEQAPKCEFLDVISMKYLMFLFYATIIAPTFVMTIFYGSIYYAVRKQNLRMLNARYSVDSRSSVIVDSKNIDIKRKETSDSAMVLIRDQSIEMADAAWNPSQRSASVPSLAAPSRAAVTWQKRQNAKAKKVIFSLLLVIICFLVSWYPLYILNAVSYYCVSCRIEEWWFYGPIILSHLSSVMNPFIYARTMPGYKEAFLETLTCGKIVAEPVGYGRKRRSAIITDYSVRKSKTCSTRRQQTFNSGDLQPM